MRVSFQEWTREGRLRAPVFNGIRDVNEPEDVDSLRGLYRDVLDLLIGYYNELALFVFIPMDGLFSWHLDLAGRTVSLIMKG